MTTASEILNADMATLGRWLRGGLAWWLAELQALVPARLTRPGGRRPVLRIGGDGQLVGVAPPAGSRPVLLIPADWVLERDAIVPDMPGEALRRTIAAEQARLLPLAPEALLAAMRPVGRDAAQGLVTVAVAGLPLARAEPLAAMVARLGIRPARIDVAAGDGGAGYDFLPALRTSGLAPPVSRQPALAWTIVAFLVALTIAIAIWRDAAANDALQALVDAQQPAVGQLQRLQRRMVRLDAIAAGAAAARERQPLALLGRVADRLPPGAFLLRFEVDGDALRLSGYKPPGSNIVQALRADPGFADVRAVRGEAGADLATGMQSFDVSARVKGAGR